MNCFEPQVQTLHKHANLFAIPFDINLNCCLIFTNENNKFLYNALYFRPLKQRIMVLKKADGNWKMNWLCCYAYLGIERIYLIKNSIRYGASKIKIMVKVSKRNKIKYSSFYHLVIFSFDFILRQSNPFDDNPFMFYGLVLGVLFSISTGNIHRSL